MKLRPGDRILFPGDSITDCGRTRDGRSGDPLGSGYVAILAGWLQALRPELAVTVANRGVSGDRTAELLALWQADCLDLAPNVLSLKVGVNDVWRKAATWNGQTHITLPDYLANITRLVEQARAGGVREVIFISPTTIAAEANDPLNVLLGEYCAALKDYADRNGALWVEARAPLLQARQARPDIPWTPDGCHPGTSGHALIAAQWWRTVLG